MTRETGAVHFRSSVRSSVRCSAVNFCGQTSGADSFPVVSHFSVGGAQG